MTTIRVVIADDHGSIRSGLRAILASDPSISVVGEAVDGLRAIAVVDRLRPDVLILDNSMPLLAGVAVARHLRRRGAPRPAIVFFSSEPLPPDAVHPGDRTLTKDASAAEIVRAVHEVANAPA